MSDNAAPPTPAGAPIEPLALFEVLMRENADSLTAYLRASLDDPSAVDDLFQDTMLIAWQKITTYDRFRPFGAWLRGIARNLLLAHYRKAAREMPFSDERVLVFIEQRMAQLDRQTGDTFDEKIAVLKDCLQRLDPMFHEPIDLHYRQNKTTDWIAQHLSMTKDAVQKRLQRARLQLADCLQRKSILTPASQP